MEAPGGEFGDIPMVDLTRIDLQHSTAKTKQPDPSPSSVSSKSALDNVTKDDPIPEQDEESEDEESEELEDEGDSNSSDAVWTGLLLPALSLFFSSASMLF